MCSMKVKTMIKILAKFRIIIASVLILSACSDIENSMNPSDVQVKSESKWKCDAQGNKLYKIYDKEFNLNNQVIKIIEYTDKGTTKSIKTITYSDKKSTETLNLFDFQGNLDSIILINNTYDNQGNITNKVSQTDEGDTLISYNYKYDEQGKIISSMGKIKNTHGFTSVEIKFVYNENGSLKERIQQDVGSGSVMKKDTFKYQPDKNTIEQLTTNFDGTENIFTFIYNNYGLIYKEMEINSSNKIINLFIYDYTFF